MATYTDPTSPNFVPTLQDVTMFYPDGSNFTVSLGVIDLHYRRAIQRSIVYSTQIGASIMVLIFMCVLTSKEKMRTLLFSVNALSLVVLATHALLGVCYYLSEFVLVYPYTGGDFSAIPDSAFIESAATSLFDPILQASVMFSLILQVRAVFQAQPKLNLAVTLFTSFFALLALAAGFGCVVQNIERTWGLKSGNYIAFKHWPLQVWGALYTWAIFCFCSIFLAKLALAIRKRRQLGLKKFGALQAIFVVAMQTMFLPTLCLILENFVDFQGLSSYGSALIALQLPLSSLWAAACSTSEVPTGISGGRFPSGKASNGSFDSQATARSGSKSAAQHSTFSSSSKVPIVSEEEDQELQAVRVHKSFEVNSNQR